MGSQKRKSLRLKNFDYSKPGAYFVTVCTHNRKSLFGEIDLTGMKLNDFGKIVKDSWLELPKHYSGIQSNDFIVMPNHIHGIIFLQAAAVGAGLRPAPTPLSEIIRAFKSFSARRINEHRKTPGVPLWQRNYYEHVVRGEDDLNKIQEYIRDNPLQWALDEENPAYKGGSQTRPYGKNIFAKGTP